MAWHLKGAAGTFHQWLKLTNFERARICHRVNLMIDRHNAAGGTPDDF